VADFERAGKATTLTKTRRAGKQRLTETCRLPIDLPLRDGDDTVSIGWCELTTIDAEDEDEVLYRNARASAVPITRENVVAIAAAGRGRWKITNENNNMLKTKSYRFVHNCFQRKQHPANLLASLILLAFLAHTLFDPYHPH
jgi:hypothetical protein